MEAVLKQLKESLSENAPTEKDKFLANLIISNLRRHYSTPLASTLQTILDCAYKWKDVGMWKDLMEGFEADIGIWRENGLVRAFRVFEFKQIRQTYAIRLRLLLLTNLINILALKKYYAPNTSLRSLHLSTRFVKLHRNPTIRILFKGGVRRRLRPLWAARLARQRQERRGNDRNVANIHEMSRISSCYRPSSY